MRPGIEREDVKRRVGVSIRVEISRLALDHDGLARATTLREATDIGARAAIENTAVNNRMLQMMAADRARAAQGSLRSASDYAETQRRNVSNREANRRPTFQGQ